MKELDLNDIKKAIKNLKNSGIPQIVYTGGEPLLREDIKQILSFTKKQGMKTILSTNGILLSKEKIEELKEDVDWISLPLDGPSEEINSLLRGPDHFIKIIEVLTHLDKTNINVKINTLVGKPNLNHIKYIGNLLDRFSCVKVWKIFEYMPRGDASKYKDEFEISDKDFFNVSKTLDEHTHDFRISITTKKQTDNAYLIIQADGEITVTSGEHYFSLGNILKTSLKEVLTKKNFNFDKHFYIAKTSYDFSSY